MFGNQGAEPVREQGADVWVCSFAASGASYLDPAFFTAPIVGTGVGFSQASSSLNITTGTTPNAEFLTRSLEVFSGTMRMRAAVVASQRIANQNLAIMLADLIGENLDYTINSATSVTVAAPGHRFTAVSVGQFMHLGGITGAAGVPGRYAIASVVPGVSITFTVAGWPVSGSGRLTLFGHTYARNLFTGVTATNVAWDLQRAGWATGDTTATINTTATPGTVIQNELNGRDGFLADALRASTVTPQFETRASRYENIPDLEAGLYLFIWSFNGTVAPASTTTWTIGFASVERFSNHGTFIQGIRAQGLQNPLPVRGTVSALATLQAGTNRAGFVAGAGIWYDDSSTNLAISATFTGTSRDATVTATATAFANAATYAGEVRICAESDVSGTLWLEVSRDNVAWRRIRSVATAAIAGGGQAAEIVYRPSWRYWRAGYTNGAVAQTRFALGSLATAV